MLEQLKNEANKTETENGAVTLASSGNACLDFFAAAGALREGSKNQIIKRFEKAFAEDRDTAVKILFFARDIRQGLGERRLFNLIFNHIAKNYPVTAKKNIENVEEYGRFDDLLSLFFTVCEDETIKYIKQKLAVDKQVENPSLLAKWLPSINASDSETIAYAKHLALKLGMSNQEYRKTLVAIRAKIKIIENNLRVKDYSFDYSAQPSRALYKYKKAFIRNDGERYEKFLSDVSDGKTKINTGTLYPYDIVRDCLGEEPTAELKKSLNTTWEQMRKSISFSGNALAVVDGSGSMYMGGNPTPASVALSLGIFFAENNTGAFKNHFITFSNRPQLVEVKGVDIWQKVRHAMAYNEVANTDIEKVFKLILNTAKKNRLPQAEMPEALYIISDMEFDICVENSSLTNFENAKKMYEKAGYKLPKIVFWNVQARNEQVPVKYNEQGAALVSGASGKIFEMILGDEINPLKFMYDIINSDRYKNIKA